MRRRPSSSSIHSPQRGRGLCRLARVVLLVASMVLLSQSLHGIPRPPQPPYPDRYQYGGRFDNPAWLMQGGWDTLGFLNLKLRESWSGTALDMSGPGPALLALPAKAASGKVNLPLDMTGTVRLYFAGGWNSGGPGGGPGAEARLVEFGAWSAQAQETFCWLGVDGLGSTIRLVVNGPNGPVEILAAPIQWVAGDWHQVSLVWTGGGGGFTVLYLDGQTVASGVGLDLSALEQLGGTPGFCIGSDGEGSRLAQGQFDEVYTFSRALTAEEVAWNWRAQGKLTALGPITEEEQKSRLEAADQLKLEAQDAPAQAAMLNPPTSELWLSVAPGAGNNVELTLHNTTPGATYQILSRQDLSTGDWVEETTKLATCCRTQILVEKGGRTALFFRAMQMEVELVPQPNRIQTENAITGTQEWRLTPGQEATPGWPANADADKPEIEGYATATSVNVGQTIHFCVDVRNNDPQFMIEFYRMGWYGGLGARKMGESPLLASRKQTVPTMQPDGLIDCAWLTNYSLTIPCDWVSGVYLAKLITKPTPQSRDKESYIIFVVREDCRSSDFLFQCSVTTYQAYNPWGGSSLYAYPSLASKVSFNRPYAAATINSNLKYGIGAGEFLVMINSSPGPAWEYNLVRWLERQGYDVTYCTSIDTHRSWPPYKSIRAFLSVGHDEYWSEAMREHVTAARDGGVNLAFLGANACYWRIHFEDGERVYSVNKGWVRCDINNTNWGNAECDPCFPNAPYNENRPTPGAPYNGTLTDLWRGCHIDNPEISLIGVQYVYNSLDRDMFIPVPIPTHWAFEHATGLFNPMHSLPGLLGYEIDGYQDSCPCYTPPTSIQATLVTLGHSPWDQQLVVCDQIVFKSGYSDMTIYTAESGAQVFATGSMQWNWGLDDFGFGTQFPWNPSQPSPWGLSRVHPAAQQMTHNILRTFAGATRVPVTFTNADTTTSGDWSAVYRPDVYKIANWTPDSLPSYASSVTVQGATLEVWPSQTGDPRALLRPGSTTERIAAAWTTTDSPNSSFTINISLDGEHHQVAVYCVDWLGAGTLQRIEVFESSDLSFSNPLDTRELLMPPNGVYLVWILSGDKVIRITKLSATAGEKAMVSGIFFGD